jgi:hypothetical protein
MSPRLAAMHSGARRDQPKLFVTLLFVTSSLDRLLASVPLVAGIPKRRVSSVR